MMTRWRALTLGSLYWSFDKFNLPKYLTLRGVKHSLSHPSDGERHSNKTAFIEIFYQDCYWLNYIHKNSQFQIQSIIDVGANVGYFSIYARKMFPTADICGYEPNPKAFCTLVNNGEKFQFTAINQAVGDEDKQFTYDDSGDSIFGKIVECDSDTNDKRIEIINLNNIIEHKKKIDILKLDCEGAEWDIIKELDPSHVYWITMEYHCFHDSQDVVGLMQILTERNYEVIKIKNTNQSYGMILARSSIFEN